MWKNILGANSTLYGQHSPLPNIHRIHIEYFFHMDENLFPVLPPGLIASPWLVLRSSPPSPLKEIPPRTEARGARFPGWRLEKGSDSQLSGPSPSTGPPGESLRRKTQGNHENVSVWCRDWSVGWLSLNTGFRFLGKFLSPFVSSFPSAKGG